MNQYCSYKDLFKDIYSEDSIKVNEPMKNHISFKVGGPADILLEPSNDMQVIKTIKICRDNNVPYMIIGNGSNLLVKDGGIRGVVIKLSGLNSVNVDKNYITAGAGVVLKEVSDVALDNSLTGFEFASGIPGSVGGAVFMNAGAYDGEMKNIINSVTALDKNDNIITLPKEKLEFGYRTSNIKTEGYIVLSAQFELQLGDKDKINNRIEELTQKRVEKQPLEYASAGSTFKRPEGYFAGKLIQDAGLKGFSVGDAEVSQKHSGFVINTGNATAQDVLDVIKHVQDEVKNQFGVELKTEVRIIGEDLQK
ncbi:UDP-N-acetylmuramate dehydrogenase [Clostridium sp. MSJ-8]|uniref:UDP-N-acetylmuramate dehydrogenase n=1 Tax=Clostridium sp. MSJ-8 TaxID=2841510 RepID=UPI001C0ECA0E|nr:UDP-N-acetylmuramate dehydrogenase [Clostridium sp. MSJ-8]MBU5488316.1 UDP-N-acetylmuramate dehydrogenase [Clostridium sp. MSJ-8]